MSEKQFLLVGGGMVLLFVALFGYLTYGEYEKYTQLENEVKTLDMQIAALDKKIEQIGPMRERLNALNARFEEKRKILPNRAERENLLDVLAYLTEKTGMRPPRSLHPVDKGGPGRRNATGGIEEILYQVRLSGSFFAFVKFSNWLEHYKRHIRMRSFTITGGGGSDTAGKPVVLLNYDVLLVSYQYSGEAGAEEDKALKLEEPIIPAGARIEFDEEARDPFQFPLVEVTTTTTGEDPIGKEELDLRQFTEALLKRLDEAELLRRDVIRVGPDATMEELKSILTRHTALTKWLVGKAPRDAETGKLLKDLRDLVAEIEKQIPIILYGLWNKRIAQVTTLLDEHLESRRYGDTVTPMLELVAEFQEYPTNPQVEEGYTAIFGKVTSALTALVEELSEYQRAIDLIMRIEQGMGGLRANRLTSVYKDFLEGLKEIKKKAEDIKLFRDMQIQVTGLIWRPEAGERICIVQAQRLRRADPMAQKFQRRLFGEGDVVGFLSGEADTVTIQEITKFKKVVFGFRGLKIAQELGEAKK